MSTLNSKTHTSDESVLTENMDLDSDTLDLATAAGIDNVGLDLKDLVESIYNDKNRIFDETFPESPPDSGSEHLLSPGQSSQHKMSPNNGGQFQDSRITMAHLDLSTIDYDVPLQILEQGQDMDPTSMLPKITMPYRGVVDSPSQVVLPLSQGGAVQFSPQRGCSPQVTIKNEVQSLSTPTTQPPLPKRKRKGSEVPASVHIKPEPNCPSPQPSQALTNINFNLHEPNQWSKLLNKSKQEIKHPVLTVSADKGFNFSVVDDAFIAQKKNHFQLTCHIDMGREEPCFIKTKAGTIYPLRHLQMNFHGIKLDTPNSFIRVEQSQTDRTKIKFHPVKVDWKASSEPLQLVVGRLHFTETTANNMRKKGKPNPSQKYFQLVASLEAAIHSPNQIDLPIVSLASERIIVRASNPGQFEPDSEASWMREQGSETIYHIGKVGINTDQASEALSVHGNIQLTGQILQPSDLRIKHNVKELDSRKQLQNVNKIKIVQYQYRPEFMEKLPDEQFSELIFGPQAGVIAQDVQRIIPDAVSSAGPFTLSDGKEINDMLIVNKERIFLENIGAVRELSKMTDHLENRLSDIESAHETVAVRLSRLRRGNSSIHSYSSSSSTGSTGGSPSHKGQKRFPSSRRSQATKHIFQNRCIQILLLVLFTITALSLTSMALVYTVNFSSSEHVDVEIEGVSFLNASDVLSNEVEHWTRRTKPTMMYNRNPRTSTFTTPPMSPTAAYSTKTTTTTTTTATTTTATTSIPVTSISTITPTATTSTATTTMAATNRYRTRTTLHNPAEPTPSKSTFSSSSSSYSSSTTVSISSSTSRVVLHPPVIGDEVCNPSQGPCPTFCCKSNFQLNAFEFNDTLEDNSLTGPALDPNLSLPNTLETPRTNVLIVQLSSDMELPEIEDPDDVKDDKQVVEATTTDLLDNKVIKTQVSHDTKQNQVGTTPKSMMQSKGLQLEDKKDILNATKSQDFQEKLAEEARFLEKDSFEDAIANEVLDKVKDNGIVSSNPREVRLLKSQVVKEKKDDLEQMEKVTEEHSEGNSTGENDIEKEPASRSSTTEAAPTNDLLMRDRNSKTFNEILAKAEDESNNSEPLDQRAKRNVLLKGHLRKIRTVEEPFDLQHSSEPSSSYPFPLLRTRTSDYDLDQQFCDPNDGFFSRCRDSSGLPRNSSLAVPLSKYFRERSLQIVFATNNVVQCRTVNSAILCGNSEPEVEIPSAIPGRVFELNIAGRRSMNFRFRQPLESQDHRNSPDICSLANNKVGTVFREVNVHFYRVCHH